MDVRQQLRVFLERHQTTGWLLVLMGAGLLIQGLLFLIFPDPTFSKIIHKLVLPPHVKDLIFQPWSLVTFPFFVSSFSFLNLLFNGLVLWAFGRIHQQLLGEDRTRRLVILGVPTIGLVTVLIASIFNFQPPSGAVQTLDRTPPPAVVETPPSDIETGGERIPLDEEVPRTDSRPAEVSRGTVIGRPDLLYASGLIAIIIMLVISCITLVPDYPIQLFLFGQVRILWVGLVLFVWVWAFAGFYTPLAISIFMGGLLGFGFVSLLRNGTDITERIWNFYQDTNPKPRMKVKYGGRKPQEGARPSNRGSSERGHGVPQEVIDGILDKIHDKGYESLSREEKELLFKASTQKDDEGVK